MKYVTLNSLNLCYNKLGSEGRKALAEALYENTTLVSLNLASNDRTEMRIRTGAGLQISTSLFFF